MSEQFGSPLPLMGEILESLDDVVWSFGGAPDYPMLYMSPAVVTLTGYTALELQQQPRLWLQILAPEDHPLWPQYVAQLHQTGQLDQESRILRRDQSSGWVRIKVRAVGKTDSGWSRFDGLTTDISELKQHQLALQESQAQLNALLNSSDANICLCDRNLMVLAMNEHAQANIQRVFRKEGPFVGHSILELMPPGIQEDLKRNAERCFDGETIRGERNALKGSGQEYWFLVTYSPVYSSNGEIYGLCFTTLDIQSVKQDQQELLQAKEAAEAAHQSKRLFLANMSHELKNPLQAIHSMAAVLRTQIPQAEIKPVLGHIERSVALLDSMISDMLQAAQMEQHELLIQTEPFAIADVFDYLEQMYQPLAHQKNLQFQTELAAELPAFLIGSPTRLTQILGNLLSNAIKFTAQGGVHLSLKVEQTTPEHLHLRFQVSDTGIGIAPEDHPRLFQPFSQLNASTTKAYQGSGLGLALTHNLVERLQGQLAFSSTPGQGSCFEVVLPFQHMEPRRISPQPRDSAHLKQIHILLAEDNAINAMGLQTILESHRQWRVCHVSNGQQALAELKKHSFDVVLLDGQMPTMDGFTAAQRIREWEQQTGRSPVPMIALSGYTSQDEQAKFAAVGINDFMAKPYDFNALILRIEDLITPHG